MAARAMHALARGSGYCAPAEAHASGGCTSPRTGSSKWHNSGQMLTNPTCRMCGGTSFRGTTTRQVWACRSAFSGTRLDFVTHRRGAEPASVQQGLQVWAAKRKSSAKNYVLSATLTAKEGEEEKVVALCKGIVEWMTENKVNVKGSGLLSFQCDSDAFDKNVYHFWERHAGIQSMNDIHALTEHQAFMEEVRPMLTGPIALAAYEYSNGQIGVMLNPIGPKGEGGLDDATGQGGSGGGANFKQTVKVENLAELKDEEEEEEWNIPFIPNLKNLLKMNLKLK